MHVAKKKQKRHLLILVTCAAVAATLIVFALKSYLEFQATSQTERIISRLTTESQTDEEFAEAATRYVYRALIRNSDERTTNWLLRLRPYLTHRFVPPPIRVRNGAIDLIYLDQFCDNASRALAFIIEEAGFDANQLNIITPGNTHTALLALSPKGKELLLDPYIGIVPVSNGHLLGPDEAQLLARQGVPVEQIWRQLEPRTKFPDFYRDFANAIYAKQGEPLEIISDVRLSDGVPLQLGAPDGSFEDVISDGNRARVTPYWHYIGNRYDRAWVRGLRFAQDTRVIFGLTETPNPKLITSTKNPIIENRRLIYEMAKGQKLLFVDGAAGYDWLKFRSYQNVDFVRFELTR